MVWFCTNLLRARNGAPIRCEYELIEDAAAEGMIFIRCTSFSDDFCQLKSFQVIFYHQSFKFEFCGVEARANIASDETFHLMDLFSK